MRYFARTRAGFTLTEIMISMTLMLFVLGVATNSFRRQASLIAAQSGRLEAQQTAQFTLSELDRELRLAGVGVADMQPILVQADTMAITFNADLVSNLLTDVTAVYIDTLADPVATSVFRSVDKRLVPHATNFYYPDSTHMRAAGAPSGAETISYWLSRDSTSSATNEHILWRRVNAGTARVVAKGIIRNPNDTVFQYYRDSAGVVIPVPKSFLPLFHKASTHGVVADSGKLAWVDSIRTIRVRMSVVFRDRSGPVYRRLDHTIRLMNSGLVRRSICGEPPLGTTPSASAGLDTLGFPFVTIDFSPTLDESAGERDVERYALYRRLAGQPGTMSEPFASIPAGLSSYSFTDTDVRSGEQWVYGVASQDCTPAISAVTSTTAVTIP